MRKRLPSGALNYLDGRQANTFPKSCPFEAETGGQREDKRPRLPTFSGAQPLHSVEQDGHMPLHFPVPAAGQEREDRARRIEIVFRAKLFSIQRRTDQSRKWMPDKCCRDPMFPEEW